MKKSKNREIENKITISQSTFKTFKNVNDVFNYLKFIEEDFWKSYEVGEKKLGVFFIKSKIQIITPGVGLQLGQQLLFDEEETKTLVNIYNALQEKGIDLSFTLDSYGHSDVSLEKALEASRKLNDWVNEIKSARLAGKELSPYEKYLYAYDIVTKFNYKEVDEGENKSISRTLMTVLTGDRIVCVGYASLLSEICNRLGIPCCEQFRKNHALCYVRIDDDKWGIHGIYVSDPTSDSLKLTIDGKIVQRHQAFNFATIKHEDFIKKLLDSVLDKTLALPKCAKLIEFFTQKDKEKNQQMVEELLHNPSEIDEKTVVRAYIASLRSKNLPQEEEYKIFESRRSFAGTTTIYSTTGLNV